MPGVIRPGLVSITFRQLAPAEIVAAAVQAGLEGIEWGGDVHVPPGEEALAREVGARTRDAGLQVAAYGSYYALGHELSDTFPFVLETVTALGAPLIRVWAGRLGSDQANAVYRAEAAEDGRRIAELAQAAGVKVVCEWHGNTLTDTASSATALVEAIDHPAFLTYWQPRKLRTPAECLADLEASPARVAGLHVFHWAEHTAERRPLSEGEEAWRKYLTRIPGKLADPEADLFALLEFVRGDRPEQLLEDAATLRAWLTPAS